MKRTWVILTGVAVLAVGVYVASPGRAQQQQPITAAVGAGGPRTRIALVNVASIIRNYEKFKNANANIKSEALNLDATLKAKKQAILDRQTQAQNSAANLSPEQKTQMAHDLRAMERDFDDQAADMKQHLQKEELELMVQVYRELEDTVKAYALSADLDLVLQYSDVPPEEANNPNAVARRVGTPGTMPIYVNAGMDITNAIIGIMNQNLRTAAPAAGTQPAVGH